MAGSNAVRRCRGGVFILDKSVAGGNAVRRCCGGVLIITWTNENEARRVGGMALSKVGLERQVVRRPGDGDRAIDGGHE